MKQKKQLMGILATLCLCMVFASCTKDEKIANRLAGGWHGDWGMAYEAADHSIHYADYSEVEFHPADDFETYGKGYQMDYYHDGLYKKISYYFEWEVKNKKIYLYYPGYPEYEACIRDYELKKEHFYGYFGFRENSAKFDMEKVWKYYKWTDYLKRYTEAAITVLYWTTEILYDEYSYYYGAKTRGTETGDGPIILSNGEEAKPVGEDRPIRIFNRFAEQ